MLRNIGLLTIRNEADCIDEFMDHAEKYFDDIVVMDDSTDGTYEKLADRKSIKYLVKFEDVYGKDGKRTDGKKQHLYEYVMDKYGDNLWITILNADAFFMDDPNKTIEIAESYGCNMIAWWVYNFIPSMEDKVKYDEDKEAWLSLKIQDRLKYVEDTARMERLQFKARKNYYYDLNMHSSIIPSNFGEIRTVGIAPTLFHYPYRSPEQIVARAKDRAETGFRSVDFYKGFLDNGGFVDQYEGYGLVELEEADIECGGFGMKNMRRIKPWDHGTLSKGVGKFSFKHNR